PPAAIVPGEKPEDKSVWIIDQGTAHRAKVKTGIDDGVWLELLEGLTGNEDVVVVGKSGLTEGQVVNVSVYNLPEGKPASQKM
ncbi:MAG: hypothetical protein C4293_22125, partial [Nitrospiraceae bacterium]